MQLALSLTRKDGRAYGGHAEEGQVLDIVSGLVDGEEVGRVGYVVQLVLARAALAAQLEPRLGRDGRTLLLLARASGVRGRRL